MKKKTLRAVAVIAHTNCVFHIIITDGFRGRRYVLSSNENFNSYKIKFVVIGGIVYLTGCSLEVGKLWK